MNHQLESDQTKELINKMTGTNAKNIDFTKLVLIF